MIDPKVQAVLTGAASYVVVEGDCLDVLRAMPDACVDAVVTDPPAGIAFMGKAWDDPRAWEQPITEHGFTDGGDRRPAPTIGTSTRNPMCRVCHLHKRGWKDHPGCSCAAPEFDDGDHRLDVRSYFVEWLTAIARELLRVLKPGGHALVWAIPRTSHWTATALEDAGFEIRDRVSHLFGQGWPKSRAVLKPSCEDWWLVRKPMAGTLEKNVATHGTGALQIDAARIDTSDNLNGGAYSTGAGPRWDGDENWRFKRGQAGEYKQPNGRWPPNVVLSHMSECRCVGTKQIDGTGHWPGARGRGGISSCGHKGQEGLEERHAVEEVEDWECAPDCPVRLLDEQSGELTSGANPTSRGSPKTRNAYGTFEGQEECVAHRGTDVGGASRFFYVAKADKAERNLGGTVNKHPTVKPLDLMRWLCRLITPPGAVVLDPFAGSGSTVIAALREGFRCIGIEREAESVATARRRVEEDAPLLRRQRPTLQAQVPEVTQAEPRQLSLLSDAIKP